MPVRIFGWFRALDTPAVKNAASAQVRRRSHGGGRCAASVRTLVAVFAAFVVLRVIQGLGLGGELPVAATYINEISRAHG
jgi:MFS family permease